MGLTSEYGYIGLDSNSPILCCPRAWRNSSAKIAAAISYGPGTCARACKETFIPLPYVKPSSPNGSPWICAAIEQVQSQGSPCKASQLKRGHRIRQQVCRHLFPLLGPILPTAQFCHAPILFSLNLIVSQWCNLTFGAPVTSLLGAEPCAGTAVVVPAVKPDSTHVLLVLEPLGLGSE